MSSSSAEGSSSWPSLQAEGPPGVEIQIIDGHYHVRVRGTELVEAALPQGVYIVRWLLPDKPQEKIVRLLPLGVPLRVLFPEQAPPPALASTDEALRRTEMLPAQDQYDSDIIVIERMEDLDASSQLSRGLRLFNRDEIAMRSDSSAVNAARQEPVEIGGCVLRAYHVPAGNYRLRYDANTGLTLDQTVVAIAQRRTFVLLSQDTGVTLVAAGDRFERHSYAGVTVDRTIMVTTARTEAPTVPVDAVRMAEIMLRALASGGGPLDDRMLGRLHAAGADPLLRLYAAALILAQLERRSTPALNDPYPHQVPNADHAAAVRSFEAQWRSKAKRLVDGIEPIDCAPDLFALRWQLDSDQHGALTAPPLLVTAWEFAAKHSARATESVPDTPSFRGASRSRVDAGAWLVWRASGAREGSTEGTAAAPSPEVNDAIDLLSSTLSRVTSTPDGAGDTLLNTLSAGSRGVVNAAINLNIRSGTGLDPDTLAKFSGALLTPNAQLKEKLQLATRELEGIAGQTGDLESMAKPSIGTDGPPALSLPVIQLDDPQKGRFGGKSESGGFALSASFSDIGDPVWVGIQITVTAEPGMSPTADAIAEIFLHDTFRPPRVTAQFSNGRAEISLRAFGGFTVGAWIPSHGVQLELDLAELSDAPRAIKEW